MLSGRHNCNRDNHGYDNNKRRGCNQRRKSGEIRQHCDYKAHQSHRSRTLHRSHKNYTVRSRSRNSDLCSRTPEKQRRRSRSRSRSRGRRRRERERNHHANDHRYRNNYSRSKSKTRSHTRTPSRSRSRSYSDRLRRLTPTKQRTRNDAIQTGSRGNSLKSGTSKKSMHEDNNTGNAISPTNVTAVEHITQHIVAGATPTAQVPNSPQKHLGDTSGKHSSKKHTKKGSDHIGAYYNLDTDEPFDKERIHREIEEKLRETLAKEGKVYPPPKVEASHPVFANDGSFLELFKKMQQNQQQQQPPQVVPTAAMSAVGMTPVLTTTIAPDTISSQCIMPHLQQQQLHKMTSPLTPVTTTNAYLNSVMLGRSAPPPPLVGRRRGGKILKTGIVAKQKTLTDDNGDPKDFWSLYLAEVNKYKSTACESDGGKRPLVK